MEIAAYVEISIREILL